VYAHCGDLRSLLDSRHGTSGWTGVCRGRGGGCRCRHTDISHRQLATCARAPRESSSRSLADSTPEFRISGY
jgi:hypothetical protein